MAKRKFRPQQGKHQPAPQQVKVDLSQAETLKCEDCNNVLFISSTIIKRLSALVSPSGKEQIVPVPTFRCDECGFINEEFRPIEQKTK